MKNAIHYKIQLKDPHCRPIDQREKAITQGCTDTDRCGEGDGGSRTHHRQRQSMVITGSAVAKKRDGVVLAEKRP